MISQEQFISSQCEIPLNPYILAENSLSCDAYTDMIPKYELSNTTGMQVGNALVCDMHGCQLSSILFRSFKSHIFF